MSSLSFSFVSRTRSLSIVLTFSKNQLCFVDLLYHLSIFSYWFQLLSLLLPSTCFGLSLPNLILDT